jgi:hypothetical protein
VRKGGEVLHCAPMPDEPSGPDELLHRTLESGRIHSAYLLSGDSEIVREVALRFARGLACRGEGPRPCEQCGDCAKSFEPGEAIELDGSGKRGPLYRHIGDHPDLYWVDRGGEGTRVRIAQVRDVQNALRFGSNEGGWRVAVIADAQWLNQESQNSLLKLLEEPPDRTCLILAGASSAPLAATIRSRCQKLRFPGPAALGLRDDGLTEDRINLVGRFDRIHGNGLADLLEWAEEYRGNRARAAEQVEVLLEIGSEWLGERIRHAVEAGRRDLRRPLEAHKTLFHCRKDLVQRNANPQMVAERALMVVRGALS